MSGYRLTPAARQDLSQIWDYTEEHWGIRQAESYLEDIQAAIDRIAAGPPSRRRARDGIREGYRCYPSGRHLIFYIPRDTGIDVIRILHQRMDPTRHV